MHYLLSSAFKEFITLLHDNNCNKDEASKMSTTIAIESMFVPNNTRATEAC